VTLWDFLRDEQNREALKILGGASAALAFAGWTLYQERRTRRRVDVLAAEIESMKAAQADLLRAVERSERRHDLLFGVMVGKTAVIVEPKSRDEPPADAI
jgi:hypothetical protein